MLFEAVGIVATILDPAPGSGQVRTRDNHGINKARRHHTVTSYSVQVLTVPQSRTLGNPQILNDMSVSFATGTELKISRR